MTLPMQVGINYLDLGALNFVNYFGISMLLIGFLWEAIADYQLEKFKSISENESIDPIGMLSFLHLYMLFIIYNFDS